MHAFAEKPESVSCGAKPARVRPKLKVSQAGDAHEREADEVSERVMRMAGTPSRRGCPCGGGCPRCGAAGAGRASLQTKRARVGDAGQTPAPPVVHEVLASPGRPLDARARDFFEPRFGRDFADVRVHTDERASESARAIGALAYTVGSNVVFRRGEYAPETDAGLRLLAHELSHVEQQRDASHADGAAVVQRVCDGPATGGNSIASSKEADYIAAVQQGKYCKDSETTGIFHAGRCYREVPPSRRGFPPGDQVCFDKKTGACIEDSPDDFTAVEGVNPDGSCDLGGLRSVAHGFGDVFPSEPALSGASLGLLSGAAVGFASNLGESRLLGTATGTIYGAALGAGLGLATRPFTRWLGRRGYVPTVGTSFGTANPFPNMTGDATWQARLYVGAAGRRPLFSVVYPEFKLGVTLIGEADAPGGGKADLSALTSLAAGIRIDPGGAGGTYVSFLGGPALAIGKGNIEVGREAVVTAGQRWRWFGVSAHAAYVSDPTRPEGSDRILQLGFGVEFGPDEP